MSDKNFVLDTKTIDLPENRTFVVKREFDQELGHPVFNAYVEDPVNPVAKIVETHLTDWVSKQKFNTDLVAHGFDATAINSALEDLAKFHADFKGGENTTYSVDYDAARGSVGVSVKFIF